MAVAENNLTWHEIREGDLAAARRRLAAVDRLAGECGEERLRAVALANLAEVSRLDGHPEEAQRLGRRAMTELERVGDPNHRRRLLATIGLALAESGQVDGASEILRRLRPGDDAPPDGPAAVVEAAIALRQGDQKPAAECFARAAEAYGGAHDPRDVVEALVGLIVSTPDVEERESAVHQLAELCRSGGNHPATSRANAARPGDRRPTLKRAPRGADGRRACPPHAGRRYAPPVRGEERRLPRHPALASVAPHPPCVDHIAAKRSAKLGDMSL